MEAVNETHGSHITNPIKRKRWATQRVTGNKEQRKRGSILNRFHGRKSSAEKSRFSANGSPKEGSGVSDGDDQENNARRIFFNIPLPDDAKDESGHPLADFERNKIRTAKYTPLSFIPKNLWFQFHTIANIYFLFVIILAVRAPNPAFDKEIAHETVIDIPNFRCCKSGTWLRATNSDPRCDSRERCSRRLAKDRAGQ